MRLTVESKKDALEALRAVEEWMQSDACRIDNVGSVGMSVGWARDSVRDHTHDRVTR
jgi:hypothetical protein